MYHVKEMVGKRFGSLVVLARAEDNKYKQPMFECQCDCGRKHIAAKSSLVRENKGVRSCGCLYRKQALRRAKNKELLAPPKIQIEGDVDKKVLKRLHGIKSVSRRRGYIWKINDEDLYKMVKSPCHYCGTISLGGNGIDRVDSKGHYTQDNAVPCCKYCNQSKSDRSLAQFKEWAHNLYHKLVKGD